MLGGFLAGMSNVQLENAGFNAELTAEENAYFENCEGIECKDDIDFAVSRMMLENNENFYNLAMAITSAEIQHYVATNEEVIYEEGRLKSIFETIKKAIKKAWEKVKGFFKKVFDTIGGWLQTDKKFVEKYKPIVDKLTGEVEYSGYTFTNLDSDKEDLSGCTGYKNATEISIDKIKGAYGDDESVEKALDQMRGYAVGKSSSEPVKSDDFGTALKKFYRNGSSEKSSMKVGKEAAKKYLEEQVGDAKGLKKSAKASYKACEAFFKNLIAMANKAEANATKGKTKDESKDVSKAVGRFTKICNGGITISHQVMNAHVAAINAAHTQAKAIIVKVAEEVRKQEGKKEEPKANGESGMLEGFSLI